MVVVMRLRLLKKVELIEGKTVLLRVDYDTPTKGVGKDKHVSDDTRIQATLPTLEYLLKNRCKVVILAKHGRPGGRVDENLRMDPMAQHLEKLIGRKVMKLDELVGPGVTGAVKNMKAGEILMLENTRFHPGELSNDMRLAKQLADLGDLLVNDAFSLSHRAHASVAGICEFIPSCAGFHLQTEVEMLSKLLKNPKRPFVAVVGGAKISDKVDAVMNLSRIADAVLVGGGVANNFIKADGHDVFKSYLEDNLVDLSKKDKSFVQVARDIIETTKQQKMLLHGYVPLPKIIYPTDVVAADGIEKYSVKKELTLPTNGEVKRLDLKFLDIGSKTQKLYREILLEANTVFWNGPMGVFETEEFAKGTQAVASAVAKSSATTILGGGDTIAAIDSFGLKNRYDYVSAAGGAALEFLGGRELPGIKPLVIGWRVS